MPDDYIKISTINGAITLFQYKIKYQDSTIEQLIDMLKFGPSYLAHYDYEGAQQLIEIVGWDIFQDYENSEKQLQLILKNLVLNFRPMWFRLCFRGRSKTIQLIPEDHLQCLDYAGLLNENPTEEIIDWWDQLFKISRQEDEDKKLEIGRIGERKTLEIEKEELTKLGIDKIPKWISIEDNSAGYDVLSYRCKDSNIVELKIEVKAFDYGLTRFYITKNEWETAKNNSEDFIFYIWNLEKDELIIMDVEKMSCHIPQNRGMGLWEDAIITLEYKST